MNINQRLEALREVIRREHLAAFIFPSTDPHQSEYVAVIGKPVSGLVASTVRQERQLSRSMLLPSGRTPVISLQQRNS